MKIKTKLFLVNVTLVITLFISVTYLLVERSSNTILRNVKQNASVTLSQISQNVDQKLNTYEQIAYSLYLDVNLQDTLLANYSGPLESYEAYFKTLHPYVSSLRTIQDIRNVIFYTPNETFTFANVLYLDENMRANIDWLNTIKQRTSGSVWENSGVRRFTEDEEVFSLKQRLNYTNKDNELSVSVEVSKRVLYQLVSQESKGKQIIITLPNGEVLLDTHGVDDTLLLDTYPFYEELMLQDNSGEFEFEMENDSYIVFHRTLDSRNVIRGMKVIMLVSLEELLPEIKQTRNLSFLLLGLSCAVTAILIYLFTSGMMRRLSELSRRMKEVHHNDDFNIQIAVRGRDEISQLGSSFNRLVRHLDELIHEIYKREIDQKELELRIKEAELYALQAQINPHFLNNVLNSIRGNLMERGDVHNAEIISLLAKSFRVVLKSSGKVIPLQEEKELISVYLRLQEYRFGDRLAFEINIPDDLNHVLVPAMSLQLLVENAITHAMEQSERTTHISIQARLVGDDVKIIVKDNGTGMTLQRLNEVKSWLSDTMFEHREKHFGLRNIHQRLLMIFGPESGLTIDSGAGGTEVSFIIPYSQGEVQTSV